MKKIMLTVAAVLAAMVYVACDDLNHNGAETVIEASLADTDHQTRTSISEKVNGAVKYTWLAGDAINVFFGASESSIFVTNTTDRVAQFKGTIGAVTGGGDDLTGETSLWGAYPYDRNTTCDGSSITMALPHEQEGKADDLADDLFPSIARSTNFQMAFYPVCGSISFKVAGSDIVKVTLSGNDNEKLAGKAKVSMELGGKPEIEEVTDGQTVLSMTAPDGGCFEPGKSYYFVFWPSDFEKGLTLTYYKKDSYASFVYNNAYPVKRNEFGSISAKDGNLEFTEIEGGGDSEESSVKVQTIYMITESATLAPGTSYVLDTDYEPINATNTIWKWSSSDASVAYVDDSGKVRAIGDGEATITATATDGSGVSASSTITVKAITAVASAEYKDEYGINHGRGIAIGDVVWAPVNCGYKAPTVDAKGNVIDKGYPYGKLYQWGRKYGQGYSLEYDATAPSVEGGTLVEGPVKISEGQLKENADKFYMSTSSPYDWALYKNDQLWNDGTEDEPKKTDYDPCPDGWRVPTHEELSALGHEHSSMTSSNDKNGCWFSGEYTYQEDAPQVFFPAAGYRYGDSGNAHSRGDVGSYWNSTLSGNHGKYLYFSGNYVSSISGSYRARGGSVRCVQE
ncbi:MAG: Ig-like domain-containing protein [Bacteroidales bacterium]|nr:Ig-like domain-containing protein [Bacteroidales bacterium]